MLNFLKRITGSKEEPAKNSEWSEEYLSAVRKQLASFIQRGKAIRHKQTMLLMETGEECSPEILSLQQSYMRDLNADETFCRLIIGAWDKVYAQYAKEEMQCELNNRWGKDDKHYLKKKAHKVNELLRKGKCKDAAEIFTNSTSHLTLCILLKTLLKREFDLIWFSEEELTEISDSQPSVII